MTEKTDREMSGSVGERVALLEAFCHAQLTELPRGGRGVRAAKDLLTAIPAAYLLGWADTTTSAPVLFRSLKEAGLIAHCPSGSDMPAALRLVASVCGLITQRSARLWTVWFSRAADPDHTLGASIREAVTPAMLRRPTSTALNESTSPRRTKSNERYLDSRKELAELKRKHDHIKEERDSLGPVRNFVDHAE